jgi:hypothetical protein
MGTLAHETALSDYMVNQGRFLKVKMFVCYLHQPKFEPGTS